MSSNLYYLGKLEEFSEQENSLVVDAEIFSTGKYRGKTYTVEDLQRLANNFSKEQEIPIQYDHSSSAKDTVGFLENVKVVGNKLLGTLRVVEDGAKERITKGLNKKLSISFYQKVMDGKLKPFKIREVSIVAFPQVESAKIKFSEEGYYEDFESHENETGGNPQVADNKQFDIEQFREMLREELKQEFGEQIESLKEQNNKLLKGIEMLSEKNKAYQVEKFCKEGKIIPAQRESVKKLLDTFSEEQLELFNEFLKNGKQVATFGEQAQVEQPEKPENHSEEEQKEDICYFNEDGTLKSHEEIQRIAKKHYSHMI